MPASFFDSNVLLYLASEDGAKAQRAETLLAQGGVVSVQVLNEVANVCRRKMQLDWGETHLMLETLRTLLEVRPLILSAHLSGLALAERHRLSIYDAMIVASALDAGCETLWSEDMHHGMTVEGRVRIVNPFREEA